jgi:HK97 family phage portal protein
MDSRVNEPTGLQKALDAVENGARRIATGFKQFTMTFNARATYAMSYLLGRTRIDYAAEVGDPTRNSIVVAVVGWIARNFPEAPVRVARVAANGTREYVPMADTGAGAMLKLLERPNAFFSGVLLWMATIVDLYTTGNAYWIKIRGDRTFPDRVTGLWWVPKKLMQPAWRDDGTDFITEYRYTVDGEVYRIDPRDVIHFRDGIDPDNMRMGRSKLASLFREIFTDDEAANFSATLLKNFGVPGVIIAPANTTAGAGQKTDTAAVKQKFVDTFGGDNRGEPMVMSGPTDIKVLSFNPEQMDLRGLRRVPEERITAVLGVAAIVAGLGAGLDRSTFTNYREARSAAYEESVIPMQRLIAAELEVQLLDDFVDLTEGWDVDFDLRNVRALAEDVDAIWKRNESSATKGLLKRSDFKRAIGLPVEAEDEVYVVPSNYLFVPITKSPATAVGLTTIVAGAAPVVTVEPSANGSTNGRVPLTEEVAA